MKTSPSSVSHRSHGSHRLIISHRTNGRRPKGKSNHRNHGNTILSQNTSKITIVSKIILSDDVVIFCLKHLKNLFLEVLPIKSNLCFHKQSSLGRRLSSGRIYRFLSVNICGICVTFKNPCGMPCTSGFQRIPGWEWWDNMREFP